MSEEETLAEQEEVTRTCFYAVACPCAETCSQQSWRKVQAWSYDNEDIVIDKAKSHLMKSAHHNFDEQDADTWSKATQVHSYEEKEKEKPRKSKRPRSPSVSPCGSRMRTAPSVARERGRSSSSAAVAIGARPKSVMVPRDEGLVTVRLSALRSLGDSVRRAENAVRQSRRLSEAAVNVFKEEEKVLKEVHSHVERMISEADLSLVDAAAARRR